MCSSLPGTPSGLKKGNPWMWSQWVCDSNKCATRAPRCAISIAPSGRRPLPASSTMIFPSPPVIPMQGVLPPYRAVRGPGVGIDPRVPQNVRAYSTALGRTLSCRAGDGGCTVSTRCRKKGLPVLECDVGTSNLDHVLLHQVAHRTRDRLPTGADHLRDRVVGQLPRDPVTLLLVGHAEEQMGEPAMHVQQHQTADLLVGPAQPA